MQLFILKGIQQRDLGIKIDSDKLILRSQCNL